MARVYKYKCVGCGYETEVYEGHGFMGQHIVMVSCPDCRTIQPLVVGGVIGDAAPSFQGLANRLCLQCGSKNIIEWNGHTCPRCGKKMVPTNDVKFWT
ncbi:MAG: hypothetical protein LIR46_05405 [Bacteroidota bacterium]|nr:hypothetical protein [Bacteroidota bacterium]